MPPKRSREGNEVDVDSQRPKVIQFVSLNSNNNESHEAKGGEDEGEEPKVIPFVSPGSEEAESFMCDSCSSIFKSAAYLARHKKVRHRFNFVFGIESFQGSPETSRPLHIHLRLVINGNLTRFYWIFF